MIYMEGNNHQETNKVNPVATGIAGAVIGAGLMMAATALKDKKNQEKLMKALKTAGTKANKYMDQMKNKAQEKKEEGMEKMEKMEEGMKKEAKRVL